MIDAIGITDEIPSSSAAEELPVEVPVPIETVAESDIAAADNSAQSADSVETEPAGDANPPSSISCNDTASDMVASWNAFLAVLEKSDSFATMHLSHGRPSFEDGGYVLRFPGDFSFQYSQVSKRSSLDKLTADFAVFAGRPTPIRAVLDKSIEVVVESSPEDDAPIVANRVKRAILADDIAQEPVIKTIITVFDGEVL